MPQIRNSAHLINDLLTRVKSRDASASKKDKGLPGVKDERAGGGREIEDHVGASEQPAHICSSCQFKHFGRASNKLAKLRNYASNYVSRVHF